MMTLWMTEARVQNFQMQVKLPQTCGKKLLVKSLEGQVEFLSKIISCFNVNFAISRLYVQRRPSNRSIGAIIIWGSNVTNCNQSGKSKNTKDWVAFQSLYFIKQSCCTAIYKVKTLVSRISRIKTNNLSQFRRQIQERLLNIERDHVVGLDTKSEAFFWDFISKLT